MSESYLHVWSTYGVKTIPKKKQPCTFSIKIALQLLSGLKNERGMPLFSRLTLQISGELEDGVDFGSVENALFFTCKCLLK